jgi:hypothetical protein
MIVDPHWIVECAIKNFLIRTDPFWISGIDLACAKHSSCLTKTGEEASIYVTG